MVLTGRRMEPNLIESPLPLFESAFGGFERQGAAHATNSPTSTRAEDMDITSASSSLSSQPSSSACSSTMTLSSRQFIQDSPSDTTTSLTKATTYGAVSHRSVTTPSRSALARPSKRRQESELTTDIEATVMALEIDRDPSSKSDGPGGAGAGVGTSAHINSDARRLNEATYPLIQNRMFDIPEIIRSIAEFLDKPSLAASCRVSKMWATHCTPLLWKHVVDKHWRDGRFYSSIRSQSHYIRTVKCEEMLLCDLPRLKTISFHGERENMAIKEKLLHKVRNTITSLVLSSVCTVMSCETVAAIRSLEHLTTLKLHNMELKREQLSNILRDCGNLEFLSLSRVRAISTLDHTTDEDANDDTIFEALAPEGANLSATRIKYLALKEIAVSSSYLTALIKICPELLELSLARNENMYITSDLIRTMKASCPRLYALDVGSCKQIDRETFSTLFTSITQLTVINLSGTRVADEELLLLAENCKSVSRLDIQYCTMITSKGLHQFLSNCGTSLRHLEASGVTVEPESFDRHQWTCTNLQILFVHVSLVGSPVLSKISALTTDSSRGPVGSSTETESMELSTSTSMVPDSVSNDKKRSQDAIVVPSTQSGESSSSVRNSAKDGSSVGIPVGSTDMTIDDPLLEADGDTLMQDPIHPMQNVSNVQYLGLMGSGAKLTCATLNPLINGFRSVKRLHVLELYQAFKKEDLEWLVERLPELCRIDAEKYNVSDELLKWFEEAYPRVQICRQE
ncbi:hypothetical protein BGZ98_009305 [Dissophora globulifera]|nr:hypothetical protein BGZ98_009305 [Dissophora globulifera]